jgi:hypothetical protein
MESTSTTKLSRLIALTLMAGLAIMLLVACGSAGEASITVSGAITRDLSNADVYYETTPGGKQLYAQQTGPGGDIQVLTIELPADDAPGDYAVASSGAVTASYFESVDGVSRMYDANVQGTLTISEAGDVFSGNISFTASGTPANAAEGETVMVAGTFTGIPAAGTGGGSPLGGLVGLVVILILVVLVTINFAFQFYVGSRVYAAEGAVLIRSLRGTRTLIRGWRDPALRTVAIAWSIALAGLLLFLCMLAALAALSR